MGVPGQFLRFPDFGWVFGDFNFRWGFDNFNFRAVFFFILDCRAGFDCGGTSAVLIFTDFSTYFPFKGS